MEPENTPLEKDTHLQTTIFFGFHVSFRGSISYIFCFTWEAEEAKSH